MVSYNQRENIFRWFSALLPAVLMFLVACSSDIEAQLSPEEMELRFEEGASFYRSGAYQAAYTIWTPLAEQGYAEAQYHVGILIFDGSIEGEEPETGISWISRAAEQNYPRALYSIGALYDNGYYFEKDQEKARAYFRRAARNGIFAAMFALGWVFEHGQGVSQNDITAYMWYHLAIPGEGQLVLGRIAMLEERMAPRQIEMALEFAEQCASSDYQDCPFE